MGLYRLSSLIIPLAVIVLYVSTVCGRQHATLASLPRFGPPKGGYTEVDSAQVDEGLYSRQLYVLGRDAQVALQVSTVLVVGCTGVGLELAKNVALAGVAEITLYDPVKVDVFDLATNFYLSEDEAVSSNLTRAEVCARHLAQLNPHVKITVLSPDSVPSSEPDTGSRTAGVATATFAEGAATLVSSGKFSVVVAVDQPLEVQVAMNDAAREVSASLGSHTSSGDDPQLNKCAFLSCGVRGVFGHIFCDFGDNFLVKDPTGATPEPVPLASLSACSEPSPQKTGDTSKDALEVEAECVFGERHGLSVGQRARLSDLMWEPEPMKHNEGAEERPPSVLEGKVIRVKSPSAVVIELDSQSSSESMLKSALKSGTIVRPKEDEARVVRFQSLRSLLSRPAVPPFKPRKPRKADFLRSSLDQGGNRGAEEEAEEDAELRDQAAKVALANALEGPYAAALSAYESAVKQGPPPVPLVPCDYTEPRSSSSSAAGGGVLLANAPSPSSPPRSPAALLRDRRATVHACWFKALPKWRARFLHESNTKQQGRGHARGGTRREAADEAREQVADFLATLRSEMAPEPLPAGSVGSAAVVVPGVGVGVQVDERVAASFAHCCAAGVALCRSRSRGGGDKNNDGVVGLSPVASVVGGVAAQEVLKAVSGVFNPIEQFWYFDACEVLPKRLPKPKPTKGPNQRNASRVVSGYKGPTAVRGGFSEEGASSDEGEGDSSDESQDYDEYEEGEGEDDDEAEDRPIQREDDEYEYDYEDGETSDEYDNPQSEDHSKLGVSEDGSGESEKAPKDIEIAGEQEEARYAASFFGGIGGDMTGSGGARAAAQRVLLGEDVCGQLRDQRWFVVGAGAIGCELLKNLAMLGVSCGPPPQSQSQTQQGGGGELFLTDMDTIERSNLNRQFLFRKDDVGKAKSSAAAAAAQRMNPHLKVTALKTAVNADSEVSGGFDDSFWRGLDGVLTALDNMDARLFVDSRCVRHGKPLVDAGTLGAKGNVQVVLPYVTESYGASADPPEPATPVCTLKSFPYKIEHTIQWARELFDEYFSQGPSTAESVFHVIAAERQQRGAGKRRRRGRDGGGGREEEPEGLDPAAAAVVERALREQNESEDDAALSLEALLSTYCSPLRSALAGSGGGGVGGAGAGVGKDNDGEDDEHSDDASSNNLSLVRRVEEKSLKWAASTLLPQQFFAPLEDLRGKHPEGSLDPETGLPFWSGTRRRPASPSLDPSPGSPQASLVLSAAKLHAAVLLQHLPLPSSPSSSSPPSLLSLENAAAAISAAAETQLGRKRGRKHQQPQQQQEKGGARSNPSERFPSPGERLRSAAKQVVEHAQWRDEWSRKRSVPKAAGGTLALTPLTFEKDDDSNGHLDFITAASNLRASAYGISAADRLETKRVAGRIVPAIATTTAVVSGLSCLELVKLTTRAVNNRHRGGGTVGGGGGLEKAEALETHRNSFLSLALPVFTFSEPVEAEEYPWGNRGLESTEDDDDDDDDDEEEQEEEGAGDSAAKLHEKKDFTVWDRLEVYPSPLSPRPISPPRSRSRRERSGDASPPLKHRHLTLRELVCAVEESAGEGAAVRGLSCQDKLVYSDMQEAAAAADGDEEGDDTEEEESGSELKTAATKRNLLDTPVPELLLSLGILTRTPELTSRGHGEGSGGNGDEEDDASTVEASSTLAEGGSEFNGRLFVDLEALVEDDEDGEALDVPPVRYHLAPPPSSY